MVLRIVSWNSENQIKYAMCMTLSCRKILPAPPHQHFDMKIFQKPKCIGNGLETLSTFLIHFIVVSWYWTTCTTFLVHAQPERGISGSLMPYLENKIVLLMERTKKREITFFQYYKQKNNYKLVIFLHFGNLSFISIHYSLQVL